MARGHTYMWSKVIYRTRPPSSDAHMPLLDTFGGGQGTDQSVVIHPHMLQTAMHCVFWHISIVACIHFSVVAFPWNCTGQAGLWSPHTSVSLGHPRACHQYTSCPTLDHFWSVLTNAFRVNPTRLALWDAHTQGHSLALIEVAQNLACMLAHVHFYINK